jgi:hypothetical protein
MEHIDDDQIPGLTGGLNKIDGFDFMVDTQFRMNHHQHQHHEDQHHDHI